MLHRAAISDEQQDAQQAGAALNAGLTPLAQLTSLLLAEMATPSRLPALVGLSRLQHACFFKCHALSSLPAGGWCSSLQLLVGPPKCALGSEEFLAAAGQLQEVGVLDGECDQRCLALLQCAATHPPLRRLRFAMSGLVPAALLGAALHVQRERLQLEVTHEPNWQYASLFEERFSVFELLE